MRLIILINQVNIFTNICTGFGSSNDGNTARKFFENVESTARITGILPELIHRLYIILIALNSSQEMDSKKFGEYALETAEIIIKNYNWWSMSPTVHKVLIHGREIIHHAILPLGNHSIK